ncbi:hypothetical protein Vretimale_7091 [Volvox reticuliferus]|uniref:Uncharacterized protein n=1 Tax=Volvox reticuliferus TaxID=1737510 RepID=A0A8J4G887_9CHLO|nr:hypothetical protein Vretimale_7091 [Volvox reticuliferus]
MEELQRRRINDLQADIRVVLAKAESAEDTADKEFYRRLLLKKEDLLLLQKKLLVLLLEKEKAKEVLLKEKEKAKELILLEKEKAKERILLENEKAKERILLEKEKAKERILLENEKAKERILLENEKAKERILLENEKAKERILLENEKAKERILLENEKVKELLLLKVAEVVEVAVMKTMRQAFAQGMVLGSAVVVTASNCSSTNRKEVKQLVASRFVFHECCTAPCCLKGLLPNVSISESMDWCRYGNTEKNATAGFIQALMSSPQSDKVIAHEADEAPGDDGANSEGTGGRGSEGPSHGSSTRANSSSRTSSPADSSSSGGESFDADEGLLEAAQDNYFAQAFMSVLCQPAVYQGVLKQDMPPTSFQLPTREELMENFTAMLVEAAKLHADQGQ